VKVCVEKAWDVLDGEFKAVIVSTPESVVGDIGLSSKNTCLTKDQVIAPKIQAPTIY